MNLGDHVVKDRSHRLKYQLRIVSLHRVLLDVLGLGKRQLQVLGQLPREVIASDRNTPLPYPKSIGDQQIARVGPNAQNNRIRRRTVWIELGGGHRLGKPLVGDHVVDAHGCQLHQVDIDSLVAIGL